VTLALEIVGIVVAVLLVVGTVLRIRKVRRDEVRELSRPLERRLVTPPPSPYAPSKGFRLLDGSGEPLTRAPLERPRLDPARQYVFSDAQNPEESVPRQTRHNDDWFLSRSSHRSTGSLIARSVVVVLVVLVVAAIIVSYAVEHRSPQSSTTTTSTTTTRPPTTTTTLLSPLHASALSGDDATYSAPAARYRVTVTGSRGESWTAYNMGPSNTLEWQGPVDLGKKESLVMTGDSRITIGSPSSASVTLDGRLIIFPSPLPATLVLVFTPAESATTTTTS